MMSRTKANPDYTHDSRMLSDESTSPFQRKRIPTFDEYVDMGNYESTSDEAHASFTRFELPTLE